MRSVKIRKNDIDKKLFDYIQLFFPYKTKTAIKKIINKGSIKVNDEKVFDNYLLQEGDIVNIYEKIKDINENYKLSKLNAKIFYEDKNITVIDKNKGVLCQEDIHEKYNTLNNFIKLRFFKKGFWNGKDVNGEPTLVNRIDLNTSGLVLCANNKKVLSEINKYQALNQISKVYIAVVHGKFSSKNVEIKAFIESAPKSKMLITNAKNDDNKPISTIIQSLESNEDYSLLKIIVHKAKKHQIRAQLADLGYPIVGDYKYVNCRYDSPYKSQVLISNQIIFNFDEKSSLAYLNKIKIIKHEYEDLKITDFVKKHSQF